MVRCIGYLLVLLGFCTMFGMKQSQAAAFPSLALEGAQLFEGALTAPDLLHIEAALDGQAKNRPGVRLTGVEGLNHFLCAKGAIGSLAAHALDSDSIPVRMILFDKNAASNWSLGWHQDRTIAVKYKADVVGYGPWTMKTGIPHVAPPIEILSKMMTVRVHLDDIDESNAPLIIAPKSAQRGLVNEGDLSMVIDDCGEFTCLAHRGDIWAYQTLILHRSEAARNPRRRRVLQVDYSADVLPPPLECMAFNPSNRMCSEFFARSLNIV